MKIPKIIIVEDEPALLHSLAFTLRRQHYRIFTSINGSDALTIIRNEFDKNENFDLLITDIQLPGISGLELVDSLESFKISLPSLIITAYGDATVISEIKRRGIANFLAKPFSTEELLTKVQMIINPEFCNRNEYKA